MQNKKMTRQRGVSNRWIWMMLAFMVVGIMGAAGVGSAAPAGSHEAWEPFSFLKYDWFEKIALILNVFIALAGLGYALMLVSEVYGADTGTSRMKEIALAIREGADAYLKRQFRTVGILILLITVVLVVTKWPFGVSETAALHNEHVQIAIGRGIAFLFGALFSATVGFVGMRLATTGNLRVAAAARQSFGKALQIGYRTGTITGMLTDGLGLLGGSLIFLYFGEKAYEALLGFGFGGTLLALFMRVGGGIYTKAADVGADLVGKIEANIPEDDPRNAATIADNVGDNVGDCAGMAADIFESYEVTIVAAMILGYASFGHKGVIFPLLVRAIGVIGSIISTYSVKAGDKGDVAQAMKAVNRGFVLGSIISIVGFVFLGLFYFRFDEAYEGWATKIQPNLPQWAQLWGWTSFLPGTLDMRPALTCLVGIILAVALNKCTEYWTGTEFEPVKSLAKSCRTGHATNIIQGIAVGYESTVWAVIIISAAIIASALIYTETNPIFVAFGVAMCGIGLLTLTGNTISMDVFGPVADNANGIGEMGYNKDSNNRDLQPGDEGYMNPEEYKRARQILADLDAVGNTTKAITKGIAIGSAVIAAVSLFASFIAVMVTGSEEGINTLTTADFNAKAAFLTVANSSVFVGMLIGGAVPFLFSSMTIRAVGRAAYLIVQECRMQFRDKEIWAGTKKPNYGRVVDICTSTAQKELVGPGLLAIFAPILVGFAMGPYALGGYLAGMIVVGQLLAVFMANSGGAWDNAKKTIEDQPRTSLTGKGSETHKASVTGDTVGDPLKDTAGPAINPLIKVMNMVSLLALPLVIKYNIVSATSSALVGVLVVAISVLAVGWAWWQSKRETDEMRQMDEEFARSVADETATAKSAH
ncbi:MAG TPA: sodium-translocating pyrophosphatase [Gemmataceae bacterium]|nr:sodium-translocating pyrophosphatase [Gemmataceae bacterium]